MKLPDLIRRMTYNPASILRLPTKGRLSLGSDADITIFNPEEEWTIDPEQFASKARNTPFAGRKVKGRVKRPGAVRLQGPEHPLRRTEGEGQGQVHHRGREHHLPGAVNN